MQLIQRERKIKGKGGCLEMERESCLSHKVRFDKTQPLPRPRPRPMPDRTSRSSAEGMLPEVVRCSADNTATGDVRRDDVARWPRRRTNEHRRKPKAYKRRAHPDARSCSGRNVGTWNRSSKGFFGVAEEVHTSRWSENKRKSEPGRKVSVERNRGRGQMKKTLTTQSTLENRKPRRTNR